MQKRAHDADGHHQRIDDQRFDLDHALEEELRVELRRVPDDALAHQHAYERDQHDLEIGPAEERFRDRCVRRAVLFLHAQEQRRFIQPHPDPQRDREQQRGEQERHAPSPGEERVFAQNLAHDEDDGEREEESERSGRLNPSRRRAAAIGRRMFGDVDRRTAIFAADGKALQHAQAYERIRRPRSPLLGVAEKADGHGRKTHDRHGDEEGAFAAHAIADAAEEQRTEGAHEEAGCKGQQRKDEACRLADAGEEMGRDDRGERAEYEEVIPLENRAGCRCRHDEPHLTLFAPPLGCSGLHHPAVHFRVSSPIAREGPGRGQWR